MYKPSIDELLEKVENRYSLAMVVSKRSRQITDGDDVTIKVKDREKPIDIAIEELDADQLTYRRLTEEEIEAIRLQEINKDVNEEINDILSEYE